MLYLEKHDVDENENYAGSIAGSAVGTKIFPLKKSFGKKTASKGRKADDWHLSARA